MAKVLRTTTNQEYPGNEEQDSLELTHSGNQIQDDKDEEQHSIHHLEETNLLIQESEETEIEQLIFNIKSSFGQPIEEEMNPRSTHIKNENKKSIPVKQFRSPRKQK